MNELQILFGLNCTYLVKGFEVYNTRSIQFSMERCDGLIVNCDVLPFDQKFQVIKRLFRDYLRAIQFLNDNNYTHLDIRSGNLMYTGDLNDVNSLTGKLIDYGFVKKCFRSETGELSSEQDLSLDMYSAIENLNGSYIFNEKYDIWSLAICLLDTTFGFCMFDYNLDHNKQFIDSSFRAETYYSNKKYLYSIINLYLGHNNIDSFIDYFLLIKFESNMSEYLLFKSLIKNMLKFTNRNRYNAQKCLENKIFNNDEIIYEDKLVKLTEFNEENITVKKDALEFLFLKLSVTYPYLDVIILFKSIDVYMRIANIVSYDYEKYALISIILILSMYEGESYKRVTFLNSNGITKKDILDTLKLLNYNIERKFIYEKANSIEELVTLYKHFKLPKKSSSYFSKLFELPRHNKNIFRNYISYQIEEKIVQPNNNNKIITISEFIRRL